MYEHYRSLLETKPRALTLGALCFKFLYVAHLAHRLSNWVVHRVSVNFVSHAEWTKLGKKLNLEHLSWTPVASDTSRWH